MFENLLFATQLGFHVDAQTGRELIRKAAAVALVTDYLDIRVSLLSPARRFRGPSSMTSTASRC